MAPRRRFAAARQYSLYYPMVRPIQVTRAPYQGRAAHRRFSCAPAVRGHDAGVDLRIGTSGYQYAFWRGDLYTERCKPADMLGEYAAKLSTVEINNTFYRMPKREVLERWASQVPENFRFAIKASRRITHIKRLKEPEQDVGHLFSVLEGLGDKLGSVLFQLPPNLRKDLERLDRFLAALPAQARVALEFRHESWFDEEVFSRLRARNAALCIADQGEGEKAVPFVPTASFGYLRLRREVYTPEELTEFAQRVAAIATWSEAYAYFKHEEGAPTLAFQLLSAAGKAP
jgi:uncharacterized protein YecE (DUF72 family)